MKPIHALLPLFLAALVSACTQQQAPAARAPTEVAVVTLKSESVALKSELAGRTSASMTSDVRPQVGGIVKARRFEEGATVRAGQVLYEVDSASYRSAYDQAAASLANAEAAVSAARLKHERYAELLGIQGVSKQDADDANTAYQQALATVAANKAAAQSARINLDYTQVRAPISGRIGKSTVTPGALVTASQTTALATIRALDPIYVDLTESSASLLRLRSQLKTNGMKAGSADVQLQLEDGSTYTHKGKLKFTEVAVDEATGSVTLRAEFPNPDGSLLPGMYVRAVLDEAVDPDAILAPQQGITRDAKGGGTAMVLSADNRVEQRAVTTDRAIADKWLVASGLKAGDRLIVQGLNKIRVGGTVRVAADATAKPATATTAAPAADVKPSAAASAAAPTKIAER